MFIPHLHSLSLTYHTAMEATTRLIPREAYRYWPSPSDSIHGHGRFAQRAIFKRQEYTEHEESALEELDKALDLDLALRYRARGKVERADLLRFLYAAEWDVYQTLEKLRMYVKWCEGELLQARNVREQDLQAVLVRSKQASGGLYTHGRDCYYRPILILTPSRFQSVCFPLVPTGPCTTHSAVSARFYREIYAFAGAN